MEWTGRRASLPESRIEPERSLSILSQVPSPVGHTNNPVNPVLVGFVLFRSVFTATCFAGEKNRLFVSWCFEPCQPLRVTSGRGKNNDDNNKKTPAEFSVSTSDHRSFSTTADTEAGFL